MMSNLNLDYHRHIYFSIYLVIYAFVDYVNEKGNMFSFIYIKNISKFLYIFYNNIIFEFIIIILFQKVNLNKNFIKKQMAI